MDSYSSSLWFLFTLIVFTVVLRSAAAARMTANHPKKPIATPDFIRSSCKVTRYPDVCVESLLPYGRSLRGQQNEVVKAAVNVSLLQARNDSKWVTRLAKNKVLSKSELVALKDCVENFGDTYDQIKKSLTELKHLMTDTFRFQMSGVQTWMSAALTNENSCLDGFEDLDGSVKVLLSYRVQNMCELISNALALVNNLAASRG